MLYIFQNFAWTTFLRFYVLYIFLLIKTHALCFLQTWRKTGARLYLRISVMQSFFRPRGGGKWVPLCSYITLIGHVILPICRAVSSLVVSVKKGKVCKKGAVLVRLRMSSQLSFAKECLYFYSSTVYPLQQSTYCISHYLTAF